MELVLIAFLLIQFGIIIELREVTDIVRTFWICTFEDTEVFAALLFLKSTVTVRAAQSVLLTEPVLIRREPCTADLAEKLPGFSVVAIEIDMRSTTFGTDTILRNVTFAAVFYRFEDRAVSLAIVIDQTFPVPAVLMVLELREDVCFELLVVRRLRIFRLELFQRDIFCDESHQPCNLCVKIMDFIKK